MKFVSQSEENECGFTCLKMLLSHFNHDDEYLYLPNKKDAPYSLFELKQEAKKYQMTLEGINYQSPIQDLKKKKKPFIALLNKQNSKHTVIVTRITNKCVHYLDPEYGEEKMNVDDFNHLWDGNTLEVKEYVKHKCTFKSLRIINKFDQALLCFVQAISGLAMIIGVLLVDRNIHLVYPIILFSLTLVLEITKKVAIRKLMKKMDQETLLNYHPKEKKDYFRFYESFNQMKQSAFLFPMNIILSFVSICLMVTIVIFNGVYHLLYLIVPLLLPLIEVVVINPKLNRYNRLALEKENEIRKAKSDLEYQTSASVAMQNGYKIFTLNNIYYYISIASIILAILIIMMINGLISLPYLVFYFSIGLFIKNSLSNIFKGFTDIDKYRLAKVVCNNLLHR